jgi:glutaredoxin-related protein
MLLLLQGLPAAPAVGFQGGAVKACHAVQLRLYQPCDVLAE